MPTAAEQISTIESTLAQLYAKLHSTLSQKERTATLQDVSKLEASLEYWRGRQATAAGTRRRVASIDLSGGI